MGAVRLKHLLLSHNSLQTLPAALFAGAGGGPTALSHALVVLDLSFNRFSTLPASMSLLKAVQSLQLNNNVLCDVFAGLSKLFGTLTACNLNHNSLDTLPPELSKFKDRVRISNNPLLRFPREGEWPGHLSHVTHKSSPPCSGFSRCARHLGLSGRYVGRPSHQLAHETHVCGSGETCSLLVA
jgi:hypothetical protein